MNIDTSFEITAQFVTQLLSQLAGNLPQWWETNDLLNTAANDYAQKMQEDYSSIKVLGMTNPVPLSRLYVSINILKKIPSRLHDTPEEMQAQWQRYQGFHEIDKERLSVAEVFNEYKKVIVLGKPGAGKTTLLKQLVYYSLCPENVLSEQRLPVFIGLKAFAETNADTRTSIEQAIINEFELCGIRHTSFVKKLLQEGKLRVLLDGLDEVAQDHLTHMINAVKGFSRQYSSNQIIITCRTAAHNYSFEQFTDVEIADFNKNQKQQFVRNYFTHHEQKGTDCWAKLSTNPSLSELASSPLLLTMLCLLFDDRNDFPSNRGEIYADATDVLLRRWDNTRNIQRATLYKELSTKRKQEMLAHIAYHTFVNNQYFAKRDVFEQHIGTFTRNLLSKLDEAADLQQILIAIDAQHGLLTERAHGVYSFTHLTLQEYFTAHYIVQQNNTRFFKDTIQQYTQETRWKEVFLLTTNLLPNADEWIKAMQLHCQQYAQQQPKLSSLLHIIDQALLPNTKSKYHIWQRRFGGLPIAMLITRARALGLVLDLARALDIARALARALALDLDLARDLDLYIARDIDLDLDLLTNWTKTTDKAVWQAIYHYLLLVQRFVACLQANSVLSPAVRESAYHSLFAPPPPALAGAAGGIYQVYYSHTANDTTWLNMIEQHLAPNKRLGRLHSSWHNPPADAVSTAVPPTELYAAHLIVLLVSNHYLADNRTWAELQVAVGLHQSGKAVVRVVVVRHYDTSVEQLQGLTLLPLVQQGQAALPPLSSSAADCNKQLSLIAEGIIQLANEHMAS